jgi:hypothetical protein
MSETQESILHHSFVQQIPKSISDKINFLSENVKDGKYQSNGKNNGRQGQINDNHRSKPDMISDNDKSHSNWRIKEGEDFAKTFYKNQKHFPKTQDGKPICMMFFIRGFCDKNCTRVHKLTPEEEKNFTNFIASCREGAPKRIFDLG